MKNLQKKHYAAPLVSIFQLNAQESLLVNSAVSGTTNFGPGNDIAYGGLGGDDEFGD
jgi:hypothetical protein